MDKLQWFKFAPSDWMMGKIMRCDEITQARYMRLVCLYWNKECNLSFEDAEIEIDEEYLDVLIKKKIVKVADDFIYIEFLDEQMEGISETSEKRREAVNKRWAKVKEKDTKDIQVYTSVLQNDTEESRGEKIREDESIHHTQESFLLWFKECREYLGLKFNAPKLYTPELMLFNELKNDYTKEDFKIAFKNFSDDKFWNDPKKNMLMPKHFLNPEHFTKYLNAEVKKELTVGQKLMGGIE